MTLFIAIVIMGILLFISFAVVNIAVKSTLFANSGRESQFAFYAADAGIECAEYWDAKFDPNVSKFAIDAPSGTSITCAGQTITGNQAIYGTTTLSRIGGGGSANPTSVFGLRFNGGNNPSESCVIVTVTKNTDGTTSINSRGYNTCNASAPRRLERGVVVTY